MHDPVASDVSFPQLEEQILAWWTANGIPRRALEHRQRGAEFVFYEGPPSANAPPGFHHMMSRAFKDVYTRYQTMRGRYVPRKAGWDCHGLPVELAVERRLGLNRKQEIVEYGVERFNALCRQSVTEFVSEWERFSDRLGFWLDYDDAYRTMDNHYIESVWWSLAQLHRKGLLYQDHKSAPYCPRCETPLSDHELDQPEAYADVPDPSVFVLLPVTAGPQAVLGASLAVWTTTPWTLFSNMAVAANPSVTYVVASAGGRRVVVAEPLVESALGEDAVVEATITGAELAGVRYTPPFSYARDHLADTPGLDNAWQVLAHDFVTTEDGTGLVHIAPAFGAEDLAAGRSAGIPAFNPVDAGGRFDSKVPAYQSTYVKDADARIVQELDALGLLLRSEQIVHSYPHCWRCRTPLLYYAVTSWYVRTSQFRDRLLEVNSGVNWVPDNVRTGRYGRWLENNVDWSLSRFRFWGTPLPVWRCPDGHDTLVESAADLGGRAARDLSELDLHRPYVDEIEFDCPDCDQRARRVPDLIDVWYDSGAMPFAQYGYPHRNMELFRGRFPAEFIAEAVDQTRGWFYTLMAEGVLLFDRSPYDNVICHGHVVDAEGRKMSKSLGNVIDPWEAFATHGSDALRFWLLTGAAPGDTRRFSDETIQQIVRGPLLTLWNVYRLYVMYANVDGFHPQEWDEVSVSDRPLMDRWILSELHQLISEVTQGLDTYDCTAPGRAVAGFVDDLSNWYVRRSRRRFWRAAGTEDERADKAAAFQTLWTCLSELSKVIAPFTPFLAESLYRNLVPKVDDDEPPSVHLADFPEADARLIDAGLAHAMTAARTLVSLGRSARTDAKAKVRQPLAEAVLLVPASERDGLADLEDTIAEELNVKSIRYAEEAGELVKVTLRPNYRTAGPAFGPRVGELAGALTDAKVVASEVAESLEAGQEFDVNLDDGTIMRVKPEHVDIRREPAEGTAFAYQAPYGVSLDLQVTPALRSEGLARELVHHLQNVRREADLEVTQRVELELWAPQDIAEAASQHMAWVKGELLADDSAIHAGMEAPAGTPAVEVDGRTVHARVHPV
ncbi:MAG TPA: isoleucine--tRNA ligase [Actinomycetota bacterium]|nr:isoleucine--tRNA ligase [Actinomycetota bacterium]